MVQLIEEIEDGIHTVQNIIGTASGSRVGMSGVERAMSGGNV